MIFYICKILDAYLVSNVSSWYTVRFFISFCYEWIMIYSFLLLFIRVEIEIGKTSSIRCYKTYFGGNLEILDFPLSQNSNNMSL